MPGSWAWRTVEMPVHAGVALIATAGMPSVRTRSNRGSGTDTSVRKTPSTRWSAASRRYRWTAR